MTFKPMQHSVAIVNAIRTSINGTIDALLDSLSVQSEQLEQAFLAELAHLDELYTDQENDDNALELVQRFDKGYAKTMASIQAATERLIEARAHMARITNTIEFHPAFSGNGCNSPYPVANADATIDCSITGTLDREVVSMHGATPGKTTDVSLADTDQMAVMADNFIVAGSDFKPGTFHVESNHVKFSQWSEGDHTNHSIDPNPIAVMVDGTQEFTNTTYPTKENDHE